MIAHRARIITFIIIFVLLVHACALLFLLVLYHTPAHSFTFDHTESPLPNTETIFYDEPRSMPEPAPQKVTPAPPPQEKKEDEIPGTFKPRSSTLSGSVEIPEEEIGEEGGEDEKPLHSGLQPSIEANGTKQIPDSVRVLRDAPSELLRMIGEENAKSYRTSDKDESKTPAIYSVHPEESLLGTSRRIEANGIESQSTPSNHAQTSAQEKKRRAQKAIAGITKGYLNYLHNEGDNLIKSIGGDPNKMPTAQQLKYERYLAKVIWCFQNESKMADSSALENLIKREQSINTYAVATLTIHRDGTVSNLHISHSSGYPIIDKLYLDVWQQASKCLPPFPSSFKEESITQNFYMQFNFEKRSLQFNVG
jgi:hypothetical protein